MPQPARKPRSGNILRGFHLLLQGNPGGIEQFGDSTAAFGASLAPLTAFALCTALIFTAQDEIAQGLLLGLLLMSCILVSPVVIEGVARKLQREAYWLVTSTALNWSVWLVVPLFLAATLTEALLALVGLPPPIAAASAVGMIVGFLLYVQWFILKAGLRIAGISAALVLLMMQSMPALITTATISVDPALRQRVIQNLQADQSGAPTSSAARRAMAR
ncbi:MAG TPA: hypothetical protein PK677_06030 [Acidiphilium sp.]|nr:MAG: hypothetical protein B7Z67_00955 [Acidiphilium sp. 21-60-14]OYV90604.1 MAG: hypothetical protein B7Z57_08275 [Acidiphilium sp. 37-60-79]HQT88097.1 hypothetical protein [Acidiphilium sp.]HQU24027.1 hypothetical protein [Acidiphilium sp.]